MTASFQAQATGVFFNIDTPDQDESCCADANSTVVVQVTRIDSSIDRFEARISDLLGGASGNLLDLTRVGTTSQWSGAVETGIVPNNPPGSNNKRVEVKAFQGTVLAEKLSNTFIASRCGSGSGQPIVAAAALRDRFAQKDVPIPVSLTLKLDYPVKPGSSPVCAQLNQATALVYSQDAKHFSSWFSGPLVFCNTSGETGYWILDKTAPRIWTLLLRRAESLVATYTLNTAGDTDATFPLCLQLQGEGGGECVGWPASVTITPAP